MEPKAAPYVLGLGLAWGLNLVLSRFGINQFDPYVFIGLRLLIASAIFAVIYTLSPTRRWPREPHFWRSVAVVALFGIAIPFAGFVGALQFQSAGLTSLLVTTAPAITVTMAHFLLPEARLNGHTVIGVLVALGGAVLVVTRGETGLPDVTQANPIGYVMVFGSLISDALTSIYMRKTMRRYDPFDVTSIRLTIATLLILPLALWLHPTDFRQIDAGGWGALLFTSTVSTAVAQLLAFSILRNFGTTSLAMVSYIVPLVAITAGVLLLGETITVGMITGMALIVTGILIVQRWRRPLIQKAAA